MRKLLCLILLLAIYHLHAQQYPITSISISLPQNPDSKTINWGMGTAIFSINASTRPLAGKLDPILEGSRILVQIKKGGAKVCGTYTPLSAPAANFTSINKLWNGVAAVGLLGQDCILTPGEYELCVRIYGGPSNTPLSEERCKAFTIVSQEQNYIKPQNINPSNAVVLNNAIATQPVLFKWTTVIPAPSETVTYKLSVWKTNANQTPTQTINSNLPVYTKDVSNISQTIVTNLIDASCIGSNSCGYIWQVQATGIGGKTFGQNSGKSEITTFYTGGSNVQTTSNCGSTSNKVFAIGDEISLSDDFKMKLTEVPTGTNDSLTGKGTVKVNWLGNLNVRFKKIKINAQDKLCEGAVYTNTDASIEFPLQYAENALSYSWAWTKSKVTEVTQFIKGNLSSKPLVPATNSTNYSANLQPIDMPIGYFKSGDTSTSIGFTEMVFRKDYAEFEAIASYNTEKIFKEGSPLGGTNAIAFRGYGIKFTNAGLTGITGSIKLVEPITVTYTNNNTEDLKITFNQESSGHIGNGIVFSQTQNEFWKYNLDVDVQLPKEWIVPVDKNKTNVSFNFQLNIANWADYVVEATLPDCTIPGANGLGIQSSVIAYDHSFVSNPTAMVFPTGYAGNTNTFFTGFYLKNFKLTLPDELRSYADTAKKIEVVAQNLIIDEYGISGKIEAYNVLTYPKANIGNLGASIDTVSIIFANNVLQQGKMLGKITLPLNSSDNITNAINYKALFTNANSNTNNTNIDFSLKPNNDISSKFFGEGKIKINQTSSLSLTLSKVNGERNVAFSLDINGELYYPTGKIVDIGSSIPIDLDLSCKFQHIKMVYNKTTAESFTFSPGQWSFASPQKKLSGFAFTITDVVSTLDPITTSAENQYVFKGGLEFIAKINIGSENSKIKISGDTKIALKAAIESAKYTETGASSSQDVLVGQLGIVSQSTVKGAVQTVKQDLKFLAQLKPKYLGVQVKSIHIDVTTPAVKIKGSVEFYFPFSK